MPAGRPRKYSTPEEAYAAKLVSGRKAGAKWRSKNDRSKYYKEYEMSRLVNKELIMFRNSIANAKRKGLEHSLCLEDITIPENCPCCLATIDRPSLDRVHNHIGYVAGNIKVICTRCNSIKRDGDAEIHRKIAAYIDAH
jgi:hypothetical protein